MFADPQSVTINSTPTSLPRVLIGNAEATYRASDDTVQMRISHQDSKGRKRHMVRIDQTVIAADPLTAENTSQKTGVYIVVDEPSFGFSDTELGYLITALSDWLAASTNAAQLLGSES